MRILPAPLLLAAATLAACGKTPPPAASTASRVQAFSETRAWEDLEAQVRMGPRLPGSHAHALAQEFIWQRLKAAGADVREDVFEHQGPGDPEPVRFTNLIARIAGHGADHVLLGAHYDTRRWSDEDPDPAKRALPIDGANDGASGVAVLLEIARVLGKDPPEVGADLVFFDGEDWGIAANRNDFFVGSRWLASHWDEQMPGPRPIAAVVVDMVGDRDLAFHKEINAEQRNPWLNRLLWESAARLGHASTFVAGGEIEVYDDHIALLHIGIPATDIIDFDYPPWHTTADTLDKCSARSLGITGRVVLDALFDRAFERPAERRRR